MTTKLREAVAECNAAWRSTTLYQHMQKERCMDGRFTDGMAKAAMLGVLGVFVAGSVVTLVMIELWRHLHVSIQWVRP